MKKLLSWILTATLVITTVFTVPLTASAATRVDCTGTVYHVDTFDELKQAMELNGDDRTIILEKNINCTDSPSADYMISKTGSDTVVLDFNGNQLWLESKATQNVFNIQGNGNVYFIDSSNASSAGVFLDFGEGSNVGSLMPCIVYVNMDTAKGFYSYGVNYTIGFGDAGSSSVISSSVDCTCIRINQGDVFLSAGDLYNYYSLGNGIGGDVPRSYETILDGIRIYSGHSCIFFEDMSEIALSIFNAELRSYNGHVCIYDYANAGRKLTTVLGEDYLSGYNPSVSFNNTSLSASTAFLTDVKSYVRFSLTSLSGQTYRNDSILFPTGHMELKYDTKGLDCFTPHNITESIVRATPQADGKITETCPCGYNKTTVIPMMSDVKLQYTETAYTGSAQSPSVTYVKDRTGKTLTKDTDYTVAYKNNTNVGTATVTITGTGAYYKDSIDKTFKITPLSITSATVTGISNQEYTGSVITPVPVVKLGDKTLVKDKDYTVSYKNNLNAGTATVTIIGTGNYIGTVYVNFQITSPPVVEPKPPVVEPEKVAIDTAAVAAIADKTYTGKAIKPVCTVTVDGKKLTEGTDYTVTYKNNINAGTASIIITGQGTYSGDKTVTFKILPKKITAMTLSANKFVYNGNARKPFVTVKAGTAVVASKINADTKAVDITYANGRKNVGTYKITVKGKGNYTGTLSKTFKINPKATSITSLTKAKKSFTVKWTKRTVQVTGYEVMYATNKTFTKGKKTVNIKSFKTVSKKVTGLKSGQKYWVKVRTYKKVNGTKFYSTWTPVKTVIVK